MAATAIVSGDRLPSKPNPAVFLLAAQELGVQFGNCIVVEDAIAGIGAARQGGMKCIAVATTHPISDLVEADLAVQSPSELTIGNFYQLFENSS